MRDHRLHALVAGVRGGVGRCQHAVRVEDVEALVLHGAEVEVLHGDDHEDVEIVFAPEALLVPAHGAFQGAHGVVALADHVGWRIDDERHFAAGACDEGVAQGREVARDQREQVARLGEGVFPSHRAATVAHRFVYQIAVGQHHRMRVGVGGDGGGEARQHVGPVRVVRDVPKALGLALGAIPAAGFVQALQCLVPLRLDAGSHRHHAAPRHVEERQGLVIHRELVAAELAPVHRHPFERQPLAGEAQLTAFAVQVQVRPHGGEAIAQVEGEPRLVEAEGVGLIVLAESGAVLHRWLLDGHSTKGRETRAVPAVPVHGPGRATPTGRYNAKGVAVGHCHGIPEGPEIERARGSLLPPRSRAMGA